MQMRAMASQAGGVGANETNPAEANKEAFGDLLKQAVNVVNDNQQQASRLAEAFQKGDPNVQMAEVMIALQKSNISFQAMVEVRNRLVSAYQEIMNMQI
jgi:flagellar hook-basal body complex protein FliE